MRVLTMCRVFSDPVTYYLYVEARHLQCFPPTRYVRGGATGCVGYVDDPLPNILYIAI